MSHHPACAVLCLSAQAEGKVGASFPPDFATIEDALFVGRPVIGFGAAGLRAP